jgi:hypothetical protein
MILGENDEMLKEIPVFPRPHEELDVTNMIHLLKKNTHLSNGSKISFVSKALEAFIRLNTNFLFTNSMNLWF